MCTGELPELKRREEQVRLVTNKKFGELILWCIEEDPEMRPSMEEIIETLLKNDKAVRFSRQKTRYTLTL